MLSLSSAGGDKLQFVPPRFRGGDSEVGGGAGGSGEGKGLGLKSSKEGSKGRYGVVPLPPPDEEMLDTGHMLNMKEILRLGLNKQA